MIELAPIFLCAIASLGVERYLGRHPDYRLDEVLLRTFAAQVFPLGDGQSVTGSAVRVVQRPPPVGNWVSGYAESRMRSGTASVRRATTG